MGNLQIRLKNCIQTILELEPAINAKNGLFFEEEFISLKQYLGHIDKMDLVEDEVVRLERVTSEFLADVECLYSHNLKIGHILQ